MRTFIAVDVSDEIADAIAEAQYNLREANADVGWVKRDNFHLTLKFLGEMPDKFVPKVKTALDSVAQRHKAFDLNVEGLGCFPERGDPRVVWAGVNSGREALTSIARDLEETLGDLGFPREDRPFTAHLTLGRVRSRRCGNRLRMLLEQNADCAFGSCRISDLRLYKSTLATGGSIYEAIHESAFRTGPP